MSPAVVLQPVSVRVNLRGVLLLLGLTAIIVLAGFGGAWADDKVSVTVSILPQAYMVERVGGDHVSVQVMVGPGQSPATYEPSPKQMVMLGNSVLYFRLGLPFEDRLMGKIERTQSDLSIVDLRRGLEMAKPAGDEGDHHDHDHGELDPHTWLDPNLAMIMADTICSRLKAAFPQHAVDFDHNLESFIADLHDVDSTIAETLAPFGGRSFYVFHPAFGYFGRAYGLIQVPIEIDGKEPGARRMAEIIEQARAEGVNIIFVQPQFSKSDARAVAAAIDGAVVPMDPLAKDYLQNLRNMAATLAERLTPASREEGRP